MIIKYLQPFIYFQFFISQTVYTIHRTAFYSAVQLRLFIIRLLLRLQYIFETLLVDSSNYQD